MEKFSDSAIKSVLDAHLAVALGSFENPNWSKMTTSSPSIIESFKQSSFVDNFDFDFDENYDRSVFFINRSDSKLRVSVSIVASAWTFITAEGEVAHALGLGEQAQIEAIQLLQAVKATLYVPPSVMNDLTPLRTSPRYKYSDLLIREKI